MTFSPELLVHFTPEVDRGLISVIAEGSYTHQAYIAGSSPEDRVIQCRAIGSIDAADMPAVTRSAITDALDTITDWDVF